MTVPTAPAAQLATLTLVLIPMVAVATIDGRDPAGLTVIDPVEAAALGVDSPSPTFGRVTLPTGVGLHYAVQGDPAGPVLVLLHGYSDSWFSFSGLMPLLPEGYRVYALTQRGHGDSDKPAGDYGMRTLAADVVAFLDALGIERATIAGHSMGSYVAQQVALAAPARVERLVILGGTTAPRAVMGMDELAAAVGALEDPVPSEFVRAFQESTVHAPVPPAFMDGVVQESEKLPAHVWRGVMAGMLATGPAEGLGQLRIPTLVLWGERETVMPYEEQRALVATLGARLVIYPETGHGLHWERPGEVARDLVAFMER